MENCQFISCFPQTQDESPLLGVFCVYIILGLRSERSSLQNNQQRKYLLSTYCVPGTVVCADLYITSFNVKWLTRKSIRNY